MDNDFTKLMQSWLSEDESTRDTAAGCALLVKIAPANGTYRRWEQLAVRRPETVAGHVAQELAKHLRYRLDGMTLAEVKRMDRTAPAKAKKLLEETAPDKDDKTGGPKGRRPDHDQLPAAIQELWESNRRIWGIIKDNYNALLEKQDQPACQRFDELKTLEEADRKWRKNMALYDAYELPPEGLTRENLTRDSAMVVRAFISKTLPKAEAEQAPLDKEILRVKLQSRYDTCQRLGIALTAKTVERLAAVGVRTEAKEEVATDA